VVLAAEPPRLTEGPNVQEFIESYCKPSKGANQFLRLRPWQRELVDDLFTQDAATGLRRYRQALIGTPRKNGKSTLGAALALYGLLVDQQEGAEVYSVAGDRMQADIVFREAKAMIEANPVLSADCRVYRYHIEVPERGAVYRVLSADAPRAQGLNPSFTIFDEVHVQPNEDLWAAMTLGTGFRLQPLTIGITTAGFNKATLCGRLYEHGKRVLSGEVDDPYFFFRWWEPDDPNADWTNPLVWQQANPAYGDFLQAASFREAIGDPLHPTTPENEFRRFRLNQWTTTYSAWLPHGEWPDRAKPREIAPGTPIMMFFDGAWTGDSVALVGCTIPASKDELPYIFKLGHWEPLNGEPIDADLVEKRLEDCYATYNVVSQGCDPFLWRQQIMAWKRRGWPIVEWAPSNTRQMAAACGELYRAVIEDRVEHDGDPALARHIGNATVKDDQHGRRIVKADSKSRIDLAVGAVGAHDMAVKAAGRKRSARVYQF
jgi:phage terminase large subunit-like protein